VLKKPRNKLWRETWLNSSAGCLSNKMAETPTSDFCKLSLNDDVELEKSAQEQLREAKEKIREYQKREAKFQKREAKLQEQLRQALEKPAAEENIVEVGMNYE
jgi:hypothetical protein